MLLASAMLLLPSEQLLPLGQWAEVQGMSSPCCTAGAVWLQCHFWSLSVSSSRCWAARQGCWTSEYCCRHQAALYCSTSNAGGTTWHEPLLTAAEAPKHPLVTAVLDADCIGV